MDHQISKLKNGLTLITVPLNHLDSVTTLVAVGAGSRGENKENNGISHFLEHMFFKGSKKYPSSEQISTLVDSIGAINNAFTDREVTCFYVKSSAKNIDLSSDILSSMIKEPLLDPEEIEREKGVIIEEIRMYQDDPARHVWDLYNRLQFGDQPLGWNIAGSIETVTNLKREDFAEYISSWYVPTNMAIIYAGKIPKDIEQLAEKHFGDLSHKLENSFPPFIPQKQNHPKVDIFQKQTDQAKLVLGVEGYSRDNPKRYIAKVLGVILGEGMSSRLFLQVRERRGLAYYIGSIHESLKDTGFFAIYAGLKIEKLEEGIQTILAELEKVTKEKIRDDELKKAKEMIRGRLAIRSESTNFLAEVFGTEYVLERKIETFDEYLAKIDAVTIEDLQEVASELFQKEKYNLEIIGPFEDSQKFQKLLE